MRVRSRYRSVQSGRELLTPNQVAVQLGLPVRSVYALARSRQVPGVLRIGRRLRFEPRSLRRWLRREQRREARRGDGE
jgi:excisionase family DNA binding protein